MSRSDWDNPVVAQQLAHRSIRSYSTEPIEPVLLETLIRCGQAAASSSFIQAYSVVRVTRADVRKTIAAVAGGQIWIEKAAEFMVYCADLRRIDGACRKRGLGGLEGWSEHSLAAVVDVSLMAQNVLLAAESVGLGGVFIGGIRNDPQAIADQLDLPERVIPVFGMCLGWPAADPQVKPRMPVGLVLHQDTYGDPGDVQVEAYDTAMSEYYGARGQGAKIGDWSGATAKAVQGKKREHMLEFMRRRGFFVR